MTANELEALLPHAWSFPGIDPPSGSENLGTVEQDGTTYFLYKGVNDEGEETVFYETVRGLEFKKHMEDLQRKRKRQKKRRCI
ncbi:MAG: hypothetical protein SPJ65_01960 [Roseburia sp.]|nr:hypothetical protein [Roseburia sp.]